MPVTSVEKDLDQLTITIVADFAAPLRRVWDAYTDPRQIERFWDRPPTPPPSCGTMPSPAGAAFTR